MLGEICDHFRSYSIIRYLHPSPPRGGWRGWDPPAGADGGAGNPPRNSPLGGERGALHHAPTPPHDARRCSLCPRLLPGQCEIHLRRVFVQGWRAHFHRHWNCHHAGNWNPGHYCLLLHETVQEGQPSRGEVSRLLKNYCTRNLTVPATTLLESAQSARPAPTQYKCETGTPFHCSARRLHSWEKCSGQ